MKNALPALAFLAGAVAVSPAAAQECGDADPASALAAVHGDFELIVDPQDAEQNLIFIANAVDGMSKIVAARMDGRTGQVTPGSLSTSVRSEIENPTWTDAYPGAIRGAIGVAAARTMSGNPAGRSPGILVIGGDQPRREIHLILT